MNEIYRKLVKVADFTKNFILDLKYATHDNFTGSIIPGYSANVLYLSQQATVQLIKCIDIFKQHHLQVKIFDGYRPQKAVDFFKSWRSIPENNELKARFHPGYTKEELFLNRFIMSPSSHSRGSTIDLTLVDRHGRELDMGSEFDFFHHSSNTFANGLPEHVKQNRHLLFNTLEEQGFKNLETEWWHYTLANEPYPDQYFDFDIEK